MKLDFKQYWMLFYTQWLTPFCFVMLLIAGLIYIVFMALTDSKAWQISTVLVSLSTLFCGLAWCGDQIPRRFPKVGVLSIEQIEDDIIYQIVLSISPGEDEHLIQALYVKNAEISLNNIEFKKQLNFESVLIPSKRTSGKNLTCQIFVRPKAKFENASLQCIMKVSAFHMSQCQIIPPGKAELELTAQETNS